MDFSEIIHPGLSAEISFKVEGDQTAATVGSGSLRVLATPVLIGFMERVSHRLLVERVPEGYSSVGVRVDLRHLAPTPVGSTVRIKTEVVEVDGSRVTFALLAWDDQEQVSEGVHQRVVIEEARFLRRVAAKASS